MRKFLIAALAALSLAACAGGDVPGSDDTGNGLDIGLAAGVATIVTTINTLQATGDIPADAVAVLHAALDVGVTGCDILENPDLTAAERHAQLLVALPPKRAAFDAAAAKYLDAKTRLLIAGPLAGARVALDRVLAGQVPAENFPRSCSVVRSLGSAFAGPAAISRGCITLASGRNYCA